MSANARKKVAETATKASTIESTRPAKSLDAVAGNIAADAVSDLDKLIHERVRLAIVSALATSDTRTHNELRDLLGLTDGNLSVHARKLEDGGYIACHKDFAGRTPRTTYKLTAAGRKALERYLSHMEALIQAMKNR